MKEQCSRCGHVFSTTGDPSPNMGFFVDDVELDEHDGEEIAFHLFRGSYKFRRAILCPSCNRLSFGDEEKEEPVRFGPKDKFWVVTDPTQTSELCDILFEGSLEDLLLIAKGGGLNIDDNPTIFTKWGEAEPEAKRRLQMLARQECEHEKPKLVLGHLAFLTWRPPVQNIAALPKDAADHDACWVEAEDEPYVYSTKRTAWESAENHVKADEAEARSKLEV